VLTHNSSAKIKDCLSSVTWASEIVVVDDCSQDDTVAIAKQYTDRVYTRKWDVEGIHRNWAYSQAEGDFILSLDSDERVTPELKDEILQHMKDGFKVDCYNLKHRNFLGGHWLKYGGWYPNAKLKLYRKRLPVYEEAEPHPRILLPGERFTLTHDLVHLAYDNYSQLISKLNYQTDMEARKWLKDRRKVNGWVVLRKAFDRFLKAYFLKKGYKDGLAGTMCALSGFLYQVVTYAKYREYSKS
jgi:(heptosyl)LPS beta-1,4-glucosyltransferase